MSFLGPSWVTFCRSWGSLGRSWALLGRSWGALGRSWAALGGSWAALRRSWAALSRSWGDLGTTRKNHQKIDAKNDRCWLPKAPPMAPKSDQKAIKNRCKKRSEKKTEIRPSWGRLGTILARFGSPFGLKKIDFSLVFIGFGEKRLIFHWFL